MRTLALAYINQASAMERLLAFVFVACVFCAPGCMGALQPQITLPAWAASIKPLQGTACFCDGRSDIDSVTLFSILHVSAQCLAIDDQVLSIEPDPSYRCSCGSFSSNLTCWQGGSSQESNDVDSRFTPCTYVNLTSDQPSDSETSLPPCMDAAGRTCGGVPGVRTFTRRTYSQAPLSVVCSSLTLRVQCVTPDCIPPPVHCIIGKASPWSVCQLSPGGVLYKYRVSPIIRQGANGGTPCPSFADRYVEQPCSSVELSSFACAYATSDVQSECTTTCGPGEYTVTTYNISQNAKIECEIPEAASVLSTATFPCTTNMPCVAASSTMPVTPSCNFTGNVGYGAGPRFRFVTIDMGGMVTTNMTAREIGHSFAVIDHYNQRSFPINQGLTTVDGSVVTLTMAYSDTDFEGITGVSLIVSYIPLIATNHTFEVNGYSPPGFICNAVDYSLPVLIDAVMDSGYGLLYFSEDVMNCTTSDTESMLSSSFNFTGITTDSALTKFSSRSWSFTYSGTVSTPQIVLPTGTFCDLRGNACAGRITMDIRNRTLFRSDWQVTSVGGAMSSKLLANASTGDVDTMLVVSLYPIRRVYMDAYYGQARIYYSGTSPYNDSVTFIGNCAVTRVWYDSDSALVHNVYLQFTPPIPVSSGYFGGKGVRFSASSPRITADVALGYNFSGHALPGGFPALMTTTLYTQAGLDYSIPRLLQVEATVGGLYVNATFSHPRQVGEFSISEFTFTGEIVPVSIFAVYEFRIVQILVESAMTFDNIRASHVYFSGYIQSDGVSEVYRSEVRLELVNITNVVAPLPSVLHVYIGRQGTGLYFDTVSIVFDQTVLEDEDVGLSVTMTPPGANLTTTVTGCGIVDSLIMCDVDVGCYHGDCAGTAPASAVVSVSGIVDAYGNKMLPYSTTVVYDRASPSPKDILLSSDGKRAVFYFSEPVQLVGDTIDYAMIPAPIVCVQTTSTTLACNYSTALTTDTLFTFDPSSSIQDLQGNPVSTATTSRVTTTAVILTQNSCENVFGLPTSQMVSLLLGAIIGYGILAGLLVYFGYVAFVRLRDTPGLCSWLKHNPKPTKTGPKGYAPVEVGVDDL